MDSGAGNFSTAFIGVGTARLEEFDQRIGVELDQPGCRPSRVVGCHWVIELGGPFDSRFRGPIVGAVRLCPGFRWSYGSGPSIETLSITGGGQVNASFFADVGVGHGAEGEVTISGAGSTLRSDGSFIGGALGGRGILNVINGGTLSSGPNGPFAFSVIGGGGPSNNGTGPPINGGVGFAMISGPGSTLDQ